MAELEELAGPPDDASPDSAASSIRDADGRSDPLSPGQQIGRGLVTSLSIVICTLLLAPLVAAVLVAFAALGADIFAVANLARLVLHGNLLQSADPINAISVASRVGFVAVGYLGLFFALMTLLSGLLGRGRGRLFIVPGALLTGSALLLFGASVAVCWSLLEPFAAVALAHRYITLAIALYLALDTVALSAILADTRQTRLRWIPRVRAPRVKRAVRAEPQPPASPPTLAGA